MAKKKREKLYCDQMAEENAALIKAIGKVGTAADVYKTVADDFVRQALNKGVPVTEVENTVKSYLKKTENLSQMTGLVALNNWYWGGRQVYNFDKDIAGLLYSQTKEDIMIDSKALYLLPCPHFYIQLNDEHRKGLFVSFYDNTLYISDMGNNYTSSFGIIVPQHGAMLSEIITEANKEIGSNATKEEISALSEKIALYMQFIVYLSAINADIEPVTKGCIIRQSGQRVQKSVRPDRTEIGNVGYRIGASLRARKQENSNVKYVGEHSQGTPKAPHIRRSHFHSFWTGSGEEKILVIKWVNTIFVHGSDANIEISTVHNTED